MLQQSPTIRIAQRLGRHLMRRLYEPTYAAADARYWQGRPDLRVWDRLGDHIEMARELVAVELSDGGPVYLLSLRGTGDRVLRGVALKLKVKKRGELFTQTIEVGRLGVQPLHIALTDIPLRPKRLEHNRNSRLGDLYVKLVDAIDPELGSLVDGRRIATILHPSCSVAVADHFVQRWGRCWNIDAIERVQAQVRVSWYHRIVQSAGQLWRPLRARRLLYHLLANPLALTVQFWLIALRRDADPLAFTPSHEPPAAVPEAMDQVRQVAPSAA
jgi:hypothetical protein